MIIIGLSGKKHSGKTYAANYIQQLYGKDKVAIVNFADALKEEVAKACNISLEQLASDKETYRHLLQFWGTDYRRRFFGDKYWTDKLIRKVNTLPKHIEIVLVADCRFQNEADLIKWLGGYVWRIVASDVSLDKHPSEIELDNYDFDQILLNDKSDKLKIIINKIIKYQIKEHNNKFKT